MTDVPDEVQRWAAKRKAPVVMSIENASLGQVARVTGGPMEPEGRSFQSAHLAPQA